MQLSFQALILYRVCLLVVMTVRTGRGVGRLSTTGLTVMTATGMEAEELGVVVYGKEAGLNSQGKINKEVSGGLLKSSDYFLWA